MHRFTKDERQKKLSRGRLKRLLSAHKVAATPATYAQALSSRQSVRLCRTVGRQCANNRLTGMMVTAETSPPTAWSSTQTPLVLSMSSYSRKGFEVSLSWYTSASCVVAAQVMSYQCPHTVKTSYVSSVFLLGNCVDCRPRRFEGGLVRKSCKTFPRLV